MIRSFLVCLILFSALRVGAENAAHFKITEKTISLLASEKISSKKLQALTPLLQNVFKSRQQLVQELKQVKPSLTKVQIDLIVQYAKIKNLIVSAQKLSGNIKEGKLVFSKNVEGWIPKESMEFFADKVSLISHDQKNYQFLVAEYNVRFRKEGRYLYANRLTYDRVKRQIELQGNIRIEDQNYLIIADRANVDIKSKQIELWSQPENDENQVIVQVNHETAQEILENPIRNYQSVSQQEASPVVVKAQRIQFDELARTIELQGKAELERPIQNMMLAAETIQVQFDKDNQLQRASAERGVCMQQLGRVAQAGQAYFDAQEKFIRLKNGAKVQEAGRYLQGDHLFLFAESQKGEIRGNQQSPIEIEVPLEESESQSQTLNCHF